MTGFHTSRLMLSLATAGSLLIAAPVANSQRATSYEAVFADGGRIEGERLVGWHEHPGSPRLDNTELLDARRPMLWLRSKTLGPWSPPVDGSGYIEFFGGDRIVGDIVGAQAQKEDDGLYIPAHLLVKPATQLNLPSKNKLPPYLRIRSDHIRRVVFRPSSNRRFQGGVLFYVGGQRVRFVDLLWRQESVVLLLRNGTRTVKLRDIAEIHLPMVDTWREYYRALSILSPACLSRLVRIETAGGLIATASDMRFDATAFATEVHTQHAVNRLKHLEALVLRLAGEHKAAEQKLKTSQAAFQKATIAMRRQLDKETKRCEQLSHQLNRVKAQRDSSPGKDGNTDTWYHMVQPIWSLDSLWVPFRSIYMRWSLPPTRVPLSRIQPSAVVSPSLLPWYVNRNSADRPLISGRRQYCWGFAVHAYSELTFVLPPSARAFRTRLGLDSTVDRGGCVRSRVFAGSIKSKPLYESPLIIGSDKTFDTGSIPLRPAPDGSSRLILQVDPVTRNVPPGADPLNVRDKLDWLDPQIELDLQKLQAAVRRQIVEDTLARKGWTLRFDKGGLYSWSNFYDKTAGRGRGSFLPMVRAEKKPLTLSRTLTVGPNDNWLVVNTTGLSDGALRPRAMSLRADSVEKPPEAIPQRQEWQEHDPPLMFSLSPYRGKKVTLELTQAADGKPVHWNMVNIAEVLPASYKFLRMLKLLGKEDFQISRSVRRVLYSPGVDNKDKLSLLDIHQLGGGVNFRLYGRKEISQDELNNVMIGAAWTGDDKAFIAKVRKLSGLKTLFFAADSGVSPGAVDKLQAAMPALAIMRFERTPSQVGAARCHITIHNRTGGNVSVHWINYAGKLSRPVTIKAGRQRKQRTSAGRRFEAYLNDKLISRYGAIPDRVWEIKSENRKSDR